MHDPWGGHLQDFNAYLRMLTLYSGIGYAHDFRYLPVKLASPSFKVALFLSVLHFFDNVTLTMGGGMIVYAQTKN
ncbi:MAG: hypothetical protein COB59_11795 [Rhodospirillaceae bacterium]|nr:MAG: hypothetical protein COB59_11795 [Rhodospirillaceae bacterium]